MSVPATEVARALLGKVLVHGGVSARIVETEAYLGLADAASHAWRGRTPRTEVIFGPPGHAYVYLIYGIHDCLNVVAEPEGSPGCVLIRAAGAAHRNRGDAAAAARVDRLQDLANGPGKLTRALGITLRHNGADLTRGPHSRSREPSGAGQAISISPSRRASASPAMRIGRCASSSPETASSAAMLTWSATTK